MLSTSLLRLGALAVLIAPTFGQSVTCISSGVTGDCSAFTTTFCSSSISVLWAQIAIGNSISACFATGVENLKCDLTAINTRDNGDTSPPSIPNCESLLSTVAAECPMGGSGVVAGEYTFTADPNSGVCHGPLGD
ncbi:hypothetical protein B0H16DRAFT_1631790 [Mycena metata]|uniref:Glycan binding protein Y3-like domain-containing protein n=1 Tax=Mycena metata TaxID=1033252 RepID=A0AAD7MBF2_9AGAR|nr:hypothetical protein B0H16DRAFT_1631790 [Mycena metata]